MNYKKDKCLAEVNIDGNMYSIRATVHALERMKQREIDEYVVTGNVLALGKERLLQLQEQGEEAIIIDEQKEVSIVIAFEQNKIVIITVIDKSNVFVKDETTIVQL